jgi:putative transposase
LLSQRWVKNPWEYKWSSASYHCGLVSHDFLVQDDDLLSGVANWQELLCTDSEMSLLLEEKSRTGRPFGAEEFYAIVEKLTGCDTRPGFPGRPMQKNKKG